MIFQYGHVVSDILGVPDFIYDRLGNISSRTTREILSVDGKTNRCLFDEGHMMRCFPLRTKGSRCESGGLNK